jgi:phenylpropionate dioxygenase-like ring-hydroxylating dioxygenase large terminal subunit
MSADKSFLENIWYFAMPSRALSSKRMAALELLGQPLLFLRDGAGKVAALRDLCPHRAVPLSCGHFDGQEVECRYHGWRFGLDGRCAHIPSLTQAQRLRTCGSEDSAPTHPLRIRTRTYPIVEQQGALWTWMGDAPPQGEPPRLPELADDARPNLVLSMDFPCSVDHAVMGLMDPAHGPFVHQSWFWRRRSSAYDKSKAFGPVPYGFAMRRHPPSRNGLAYRLLGGRLETEILFTLPGQRVESITAGQRRVISHTAITPLNERTTRITHMMYWNMPWGFLLKPLLRRWTRLFLGQDRAIVALQERGLRYDPPLTFIADADTQARWYAQLKREYRQAQAEKRPFINPVPETVLAWRS